jgi:hypothetical protein
LSEYRLPGSTLAFAANIRLPFLNMIKPRIY